MTHGGRRLGGTVLLVLAALGMSACAPAGPAAELEEPARVRTAPGESYLALGTRLLAANEPALAMRAFNASIAAEGVGAEALTGAGIAAQRQGMLGTARAYLERARDLAPASAIAQSNLGMVLLALGDHHGARTAFRAAMALSGEDGDAALERHLERAELAVAASDANAREDPAATQRVVRLGSDWFRITEKSASTGAASAAGASSAPAMSDDATTIRQTGNGAGPVTGSQAAGEITAPVEAGTGSRAALSHAATPGAAAGTQGPAMQKMLALANEDIENGAE